MNTCVYTQPYVVDLFIKSNIQGIIIDNARTIITESERNFIIILKINKIFFYLSYQICISNIVIFKTCVFRFLSLFSHVSLKDTRVPNKRKIEVYWKWSDSIRDSKLMRRWSENDIYTLLWQRQVSSGDFVTSLVDILC